MVRPVVATTAAVAAGALLTPGLARVAASAPAAALEGVRVEPADALLSATALTALVLGTWLLLGVVLEAVGRLPGAVGRTAARLSSALTPRLVRRAVGAALGLGVGVGLGAGPSLAAPVREVSAAVRESARDTVLAVGDRGSPTAPGTALPDPGWSPPPDPGWTPEPPVVRPQPDVATVSTAARRPAVEAPAEVVVRRGDSLWSVAARHLGPAATDAEVAAEWPRWYEANRAVVGPDPDLILPGQVLRPPEAAT